MFKKELEDLEKTLMDEVVRRRRLGGYSVEAEGVLILSESLLKIVQHLRERTPQAPKNG